jgi:hypothetical protein
MSKLTLREIAKEYGRKPRTFKKYVIENGIPHELLGRTMYFDATAVSLHLKAVHYRKNNVVKMPAVKRRRLKVVGESKFAEAIGR